MPVTMRIKISLTYGTLIRGLQISHDNSSLGIPPAEYISGYPSKNSLCLLVKVNFVTITILSSVSIEICEFKVHGCTGGVSVSTGRSKFSCRFF